MRVPALEFRRKGWHMISGVLVAPLIVVTDLVYATLVLAAAVLFIVVAELLHVGWGIQVPFWSRQLARTKRAHERFSLASLAFLLTIVGLLWLAPLPVALAAAAQLALGDGASALVGGAVGRLRIPYNRDKTLEGSLAGFIAGAVGAYLILLWYAAATGTAMSVGPVSAVCAGGAFLAMVAESLPRLEDNVTVPLAAGLGMTALWALFGLEPTMGAIFGGG